MKAIVTIFESKKKSATENKGEGRILFQHTYQLKDTIKPNGELHKTNENANLKLLKGIKKNFEEKFSPDNFLEVQFDAEEDIAKLENK